MTEKVEFDHYPEVVADGKGIRRLELMGLDEHLADPAERRRLFETMSNEGYTKMFGFVNSLTRGEKPNYSYEDGNLPMLETPKLEDKSALMDATFESVRGILSDRETDDATALRRAGLTMAGAIDYIHPKENGNGRTGRTLHYLMEFGTGRGDRAFGDEMYAVIGKLPMYDTDSKKALDDSPPSQLENALNQEIYRSVDETTLKGMDARDLAAARVITFLDMMSGNK
jgi:hypothetical protein